MNQSCEQKICIKKLFMWEKLCEKEMNRVKEREEKKNVLCKRIAEKTHE